MTKDELLLMSGTVNGSITNFIDTTLVREFFESNICIPKGENRHPDADVLHEIAENPNKHLQMQHKSNMCDWDTFDLYTNYVFRIKPSEPIYEWQWIVGCIYGIDAITEKYHTEEELEGIPFRKIEETKQVRV